MNWRGFLTPALLLGALWLLLTAGSPGSWLIGVPTVVLAAWVAARQRKEPTSHFCWRGLGGFLSFFLRESFRGGIDVAARVFAPSMRLAPGFRDFTMTLEDPRAQRLFVNSISLLPGTLSADLHGNTVRIHALDTRADIELELSRLQDKVARVYVRQG